MLSLPLYVFNLATPPPSLPFIIVLCFSQTESLSLTHSLTFFSSLFFSFFGGENLKHCETLFGKGHHGAENKWLYYGAAHQTLHGQKEKALDISDKWV